MIVLRNVVIGLAVFLAAATGVSAATYHVDVAAGNASDTNKGTAAAPFKSISHAATVVKPGDTVTVASGKYYELVEVKTSGTKDAKITFRAAEKQGPVAWGFKLLADHIVISGFTFTNTLTQVRYGKEVGVPGVYAGETFYNNPDGDDSRYGTCVYGCNFYDIGAFAVKAGRGAHIKGNYIRNCRGGVSVNDTSLVEGNEVDGLMLPLVAQTFDTTRLDIPAQKKVWQGAKFMFYYGNNITFRNNYLHGVHPRKASSSIDFFTSWDAWRYGPSTNILIEGNRCSGTTHGTEPSGDVLKQSSHITFRNNLYMNTVYVGIYCKYYTHITVENNTFINCGAYPVWFRSERETQGSVVKNNVFSYYRHNELIRQGRNHKQGDAAIRVDDRLKGQPDIDGNLIWATENRQYGKNDVTAEPTFRDPDNGDFRLTEDSPGQGKGMDLAPWPGLPIFMR